jgi:hypothetical protein
MVRTGLEATAALWPPIQAAYTFVHQAAHLLANHDQLDVLALQQTYQDLLAEFCAAFGAAFGAAPTRRTPTARRCRPLPDRHGELLARPLRVLRRSRLATHQQ